MKTFTGSIVVDKGDGELFIYVGSIEVVGVSVMFDPVQDFSGLPEAPTTEGRSKITIQLPRGQHPETIRRPQRG